jgi:hypothetical protein
VPPASELCSKSTRTSFSPSSFHLLTTFSNASSVQCWSRPPFGKSPTGQIWTFSIVSPAERDGELGTGNGERFVKCSTPRPKLNLDSRTKSDF